jgi:serine/threonine protein kinase
VSEPTNSSQWHFPRPYGQYQLLERIGFGGMAEVFRARRGGAQGFEKIVVIKRILPHLAEQDRFVRMFVNEAKIAAQIQHQNVVQVFDLGQSSDGELYIAMEHVSGLDLRKLFAVAEEKLLFLPTWFSLHVVREVLTALSHAHDLTDTEGRQLRIIHRDVTPANIFISWQGEVKLADFGIAKAIGENPDTEAGQVKGNVSYMAPEALLGEPLDHRADVFSAGVCLWESLTQQRLFQGRSNFEIARIICDSDRPPPSRFNPEVSPELDASVLKALEIDRERRFQSSNEMLATVVDALSQLRPKLVRNDVREVIDVLNGKASPPVEMTVRTARSKPPIPGATTANAPLPPLPRHGSGIDLPPLVAFGAMPWQSVTPVPALPGLAIPGTTTPPPPQALPQQPIVAPLSSAQVAPRAAQRHQAADSLDMDLDMAPVGGALLNEWVDWVNQQGTPVLQSTVDDAPLELAYEESSGEGTIFVRDGGGRISGPFSYHDLSRMRGVKPAEVSVDRARWMDIDTFVQLSGIDRLAPHPSALRKVTLVGKLETRSLCSILSQLGRDRSTGRLVLMESGHQNSARREIFVVRGAPVFVFSDHPDMQLPTLLARHQVVREDQLDQLVAQAIERKQPILDLISWTAFTDINRYWPLMMRDRLAEVFRWGTGRFAFDADAEPPRTTPFAKSLLAVLIEGVHRSYNLGELTTMLSKHMNAKLGRSDTYAPALKALALNEKQAEIASRLGTRKTLAELLRKHTSDSQPMLVIAYVLIEMGVITTS